MLKAGIWTHFNDVIDPELQELAKLVPGLAMRSKQDGTIKAYLSGFTRWRNWAARFPEINVIPAQPKYVSLYLANVLKNSKTHAPVTNAFYAISWAHKLACVPDPTEHDLVKRVRESSHRILGSGSNTKSPISSDILFKLCNRYGGVTANLKDLRIMCICVLAYSGFFRYDEFSNILLSDIVLHDNFMTVFIEKSKTDVHRDGKHVYIAATGSECCPVKLIKRYIACAKLSLDSNLYLFRGLVYHRRRKFYTFRRLNKGISYTSARELVLSAFSSVGLDVKLFGTHSLRKGGATAAAEHHVCDRLIMKHGRWQSEKSKDLYISESVRQKLSVTKNLGI